MAAATRVNGIRAASAPGSSRKPSLVEPLGAAPVDQQRPARLRRALVEESDLLHPVEAEMAERRPRLAPGGEHPGMVEETERDRPDDARRGAPVLVDIGEGELAPGAERLADQRQARRLGFACP